MFPYTAVAEWLSQHEKPEKLYSSSSLIALYDHSDAIVTTDGKSYWGEWWCLVQMVADPRNFSSELNKCLREVSKMEETLQNRKISVRWKWEMHSENHYMGRWIGQ